MMVNSKSRGPGSNYVSLVDKAYPITDLSDTQEVAWLFLSQRPLPKIDVNKIQRENRILRFLKRILLPKKHRLAFRYYEGIGHYEQTLKDIGHEFVFIPPYTYKISKKKHIIQQPDCLHSIRDTSISNTIWKKRTD
jgi:hypothetical protein